MSKSFDIKSDWLVTVVDHGLPPNRPKIGESEKKRQELLNIWLKYVNPITTPGDADYEEFYEHAARLDAAIKVFKPEHVWLINSKNMEEATNLLTQEKLPVADLTALRRWGLQHKNQEPLVSLDSERLANNYADLKAFQNNAGRTLYLSTSDGKDETGHSNLMKAIRNIAEQDILSTGKSYGKVFVKVNRAKYAIYQMEITQDTLNDKTGKLLDEQVMDEIGFTLVHLEDVPGGFLVQAHTIMEYEYRFLVANHEVSTGAGCIEEYTPLDNLTPFDPQVRRRRGQNDPITQRPDLVNQMLPFAKKVAEQVKKESPKLNNYSLDIALSPEGQPMVIEMNGLLNSGLYASQPELVVKALARTEPIMGDPRDSLFGIKGPIIRL